MEKYHTLRQYKSNAEVAHVTDILCCLLQGTGYIRVRVLVSEKFIN